MTHYVVYQDGSTFYDDERADELFTSAIVVPDLDIETAKMAREEFTDWFKREHQDDTMSWAGENNGSDE